MRDPVFYHVLHHVVSHHLDKEASVGILHFVWYYVGDPVCVIMLDEIPLEDRLALDKISYLTPL